MFPSQAFTGTFKCQRYETVIEVIRPCCLPQTEAEYTKIAPAYEPEY